MTAKTARRYYQKEGRRQIPSVDFSLGILRIPTTTNHPSFTTALQLKALKPWGFTSCLDYTPSGEQVRDCCLNAESLTARFELTCAVHFVHQRFRHQIVIKLNDLTT
jgi:hypothetical protein